MIMIVALSQPAVQLAIIAGGVFFMTALVTGVWKYVRIARSPNATAPVYVDIAHRAALFYSFAAMLLAQFAALSAWDDTLDLWATAIPLLFFAKAIGGYIVHGWLDDTDNQFRAPHKVGSLTLPAGALAAFMWLLTIGEIGGFAVLFSGTLRTLGWL